jgi:hypothetical protein
VTQRGTSCFLDSDYSSFLHKHFWPTSTTLLGRKKRRLGGKCSLSLSVLNIEMSVRLWTNEQQQNRADCRMEDQQPPLAPAPTRELEDRIECQFSTIIVPVTTTTNALSTAILSLELNQSLPEQHGPKSHPPIPKWEKMLDNVDEPKKATNFSDLPAEIRL